MPDLFQVTDVFGDTVCLPDRRWYGHILLIHPEIRPFLNELETTIQRPDCVYSSESDADVKLFYKRGIGQGKYRNLYLKVVVSYRTQPAIVKTAFFTNALTGGSLLWIKNP